MRITVRLFGHYSDYAAEPLEMEMPDGATIGDVAVTLAGRDQRLAGIDKSCRAAVNEEYCRSDEPVHEADEVAFIPPMSGG